MVSPKIRATRSLSDSVLGFSGSNIETWPTMRKACFAVVSSTTTDMALSLVILLNIILMIMETDTRAAGEEIPGWVTTTGYFFLTTYIVELTVRLYVFRWHFFMSNFNIMDFAIVGIDCVFEALGFAIGDMPDVTMLRILRVLRSLRFVRAVRSLVFFRELYMIMNGFFAAMKAIIWATVLLFVVLMLWSVVAVELVNPLVKEMEKKNELVDAEERMPRAFSSTMNSMLTFTQTVVAMDAWGDFHIPVIEKHPYSMILFLAVLVTVNLGLMNLILSVIVGKAQQARQEDLTFKIQEKEEEYERMKKELLALCAELDEDSSSLLTLDELLQGFDSNPEFHLAMAAMDVSREDMSNLFNVLDEDGSGEVAYEEFVDQLHKTKTQDSHVVLVFIRGLLKDIAREVKDHDMELTKVEARLDTYEERSSDVLRMVSDLSNMGANDFRSPEQPVVFSAQSTAGGRRGSGCSAAAGDENIDEEVKALREKVAQMKTLMSSEFIAQLSQPCNSEIARS